MANNEARAQRTPRSPPAPAEGDDARAVRLARERRQIEEARVSIAAGRVVSEQAFSAWVDSIGTDNELPVPQSR
jgi:predicted transcriptional regulator